MAIFFFFFFKKGSCSVAQAAPQLAKVGLELVVLLPWSLKCSG